MKLFDYLALAAALTLTAFSFVLAFSHNGESLEVLIEAEGRQWIYPIDSVLTLELHGPVGHTVVSIDGGLVRVTESDCSEQICVQAGAIKNSGQWIACMPNRVFITVRGKKDGGIDGEAY